MTKFLELGALENDKLHEDKNNSEKIKIEMF